MRGFGANLIFGLEMQLRKVSFFETHGEYNETHDHQARRAPNVIKPIMTKQFFLRQPSEEVTAADAHIVRDLVDTLETHRAAEAARKALCAKNSPVNDKMQES